MPKTYEPINHCIYCGQSFSDEDLTKEHIIPYGLWGDAILPKSSCKPCAKETSQIEEVIQKRLMGDARNVAKSPTRNKKDRSSTIAIDLIHSGESVFPHQISIDEAMAFFHFPIYESPRSVYGGKELRGIGIKGYETIQVGKDPRDLLDKQKAIGFRGKFRLDYNFPKFLSKIAYAYYCSKNGVFPRTESPALAILLGQEKNPGLWLGTSYAPILDPQKIGPHTLAIERVSRQDCAPLDMVRLKFFSASGLGTYDIVVREFTSENSTHQISDESLKWSSKSKRKNGALKPEAQHPKIQ